MGALAAQESKLAEFSKKAGLDQKKFAQSFAKVERERVQKDSKALKDKTVAEKASAQDAKKNQSAAARNEQLALKRVAQDAKKNDAVKAKSEKDAKKAKATAEATRDKAAKRTKKDDTELLGIAKQSAVAVLGIGAAALAAAVGVAKLALDMGRTKKETAGALDILTNGRADKALALIDATAVKLGVAIQGTRDDFIAFRQAGLGNKASIDLIKLKADLIATKHPAEQVQEAVDRVLSFTSNGTQTKDQVQASARAMKLLAKQAHVAGDGTKAAAIAATTLDGALARIDNSKTKVLEEIGDKIQPSVDKAATAIANLVDALVSSEKGQKAIQKVEDTIIAIADIAEKTAPKIKKLIDDGALEDGASALGVVKDALWEVGAAAWEIPKAFYIVASNINDAVNLIGESVIDVGATIWDALVNLPANAKFVGKEIVDGLVSGVTSATGSAIKAITDLAHGIKSAFKSALHINSPSKDFDKFGEFSGQGYERGITRAMPTGDEIAEQVRPIYAPNHGQAPAVTASSSAGSRTISVTIQNLNVPRGEDPDVWMRSARREMTLFAESLAISQGIPLGEPK